MIVAILTSLGARASPHSALLGIAGPDVENGEGSPDIVLSAGVRRENAWRAIVKRATDLCSSMEILQVPSARNAQTLVAFVQMLMRAFFRGYSLCRESGLFLSRIMMTDSAAIPSTNDTVAEAKPRTARFFLRTAMGIFRDMQHSDLPPEEVRAIKASVGPTLFVRRASLSTGSPKSPLTRTNSHTGMRLSHRRLPGHAAPDQRQRPVRIL